MFYQTQRAFRQGSAQVDIQEGGRSVMEMVTAELQQITPTFQLGEVNIYASNAFPVLVQPRPGGGAPQRNLIQDTFFLTRLNDSWVGTGYIVDAPLGDVGTLYRYVTTEPLTDAAKLPVDFQTAIKSFPTNWGHVADRVLDFQLSPYDSLGRLSTNVVNSEFIYTNFPSDRVPAYLDLELGILEPRTFEQYRGLTNISPARAHTYLEQHVDKVQLFRQRIPIRTATVP
jgi:hypothetical protein